MPLTMPLMVCNSLLRHTMLYTMPQFMYVPKITFVAHSMISQHLNFNLNVTLAPLPHGVSSHESLTHLIKVNMVVAFVVAPLICSILKSSVINQLTHEPPSMIQSVFIHA